MGQSSYVHVTCDLLAYTDKAVRIMAGGETHWIPFSQLAPGEHEKVTELIDEGTEDVVADCTLTMTEWIAGEKGIEPDE